MLTDQAAFVTIQPTLGTYAGAPTERIFRIELSADSKTVWRMLLNDRPLTFYADPLDLEEAYEGWSIDSTGLVLAKTDWTSVWETKIFEFDFR